jgi:growth arrest-specific protein 2
MTTTASEETTISELKADSPISDIVDPVKEMETKFAKCGIVMNDDEISVDIASATGLRKTDFSEVLYEDNPIIAARKAAASRIPKSPLMTRRKSMENCSLTEKNEDDSLRKVSTYRSVRNKPQHSPQHQQHQKLQSKENGTWSGRSSISPTNQSRKRPVLTSDTFKSPSRTASLTRNTPTRSSQQQPRQRSSTRASSVNTSPNKSANTSQSQLAQQLLDAAGKAKNDAQILDKIKQILSDYATKNKVTNDFEDFTTTWVNNNGQLADATDSANGSPLKSQSKRSSSVSTSSDSNPTTSVAAAALTPRRIDKGLSRIPAPIRSNTGLY